MSATLVQGSLQLWNAVAFAALGTPLPLLLWERHNLRHLWAGAPHALETPQLAPLWVRGLGSFRNAAGFATLVRGSPLLWNTGASAAFPQRRASFWDLWGLRRLRVGAFAAFMAAGGSPLWRTGLHRSLDRYGLNRFRAMASARGKPGVAPLWDRCLIRFADAGAYVALGTPGPPISLGSPPL